MSPFSTTNNNGHLDTGIKKTPLLTHKLNGTEITAVRQLITGNKIIILLLLYKINYEFPGYRESAAFLLRSADELENLLQLQPKL